MILAYYLHIICVLDGNKLMFLLMCMEKAYAGDFKKEVVPKEIKYIAANFSTFGRVTPISDPTSTNLILCKKSNFSVCQCIK